jgi:hypothetical protein
VSFNHFMVEVWAKVNDWSIRRGEGGVRVSASVLYMDQGPQKKISLD